METIFVTSCYILVHFPLSSGIQFVSSFTFSMNFTKSERLKICGRKELHRNQNHLITMEVFFIQVTNIFITEIAEITCT